MGQGECARGIVCVQELWWVCKRQGEAGKGTVAVQEL